MFYPFKVRAKEGCSDNYFDVSLASLSHGLGKITTKIV